MSAISEKLRKIRKRVSQKLKKMKHVKDINRNIFYARQLLLNNYIDTLKANDKYKNDKCLIKYGRKIFSQNEEDGIIQEIFNRIGTSSKVFVEFGIGDGLENNTLALLMSGWQGLWIEGSTSSVNTIRDHFRSVIESGTLKIEQAFITKDNINELISSNISSKEIDLLSVDIDGNDIHIFNEISVINSRVVVMEYNAKFPPPIMFSVDYNPTHAWQGDDYMGSSLKLLETRMADKGYKLVGCDISGTNAFFVRDDLVEDKFASPYTAENHYQPARYYLVGCFSGHQATHISVEKVLKASMKLNK